MAVLIDTYNAGELQSGADTKSAAQKVIQRGRLQEHPEAYHPGECLEPRRKLEDVFSGRLEPKGPIAQLVRAADS